MPIFETRGGYLYVEGVEPYSKKQFFQSIQQISDTCNAGSLDKALIDLRKIHDYISILDRFDLGKEIARVIGPKIKVAVIANFNVINYLAENSAGNRGAKIKVFTDAHQATEWLNINP